MTFYLGTHVPHWLTRPEFRGVPLFVSVRTLRQSCPRIGATTRYAVDSGAFTEVASRGGFVTTPRDYATELRYLWDVLGPFDFAAPQDWMCEPFVLAKTGLSVPEHQRRTTENYLTLRGLCGSMSVIPVLQGYEIEDYLYHVRQYRRAGVDLTALPRVGVGSVCRRQGTAEIADLFRALAGAGIRCHGFGVKSAGLERSRGFLASSDSLAWSRGARYARPLPGCRHGESGRGNCANCPRYALKWYRSVVASAHVGKGIA